MRHTKSGWTALDLARLYKGFGFIAEEDTNHTTYLHLSSAIRTQVSRHPGELPIGYVSDAVKDIDKLLRWEQKQKAQGTDE